MSRLFRCLHFLAYLFRGGHDSKRISAQDLPDIIVGISFSEECLGDLGQLRAILHAFRHIGSIKVGTETYVVGTDKLYDMIDVLDNFLPADVR